LDVVAVLLAGLLFGEADAGDLRVGVDRAGNAAVVDDGVVAQRVLGRDLAFAEGGVRELPVAGAVADRVDVRLGRAAVLVGGDALPLVELDADLLEAEILHGWPAPGRDEHQVGLDGLPAEMDAQPTAGVLDLVTGGLEVECDPALLELLRELLPRVRVLLRDQLGEHLDDRHLGAEAPEDRGELAADDSAPEDDEVPGDLRLREQAL